jgi:uncharacterized protein with HEPN domain
MRRDRLLILLVRTAIVHQLTVIGEAVARLSPALRDQNPGIPWTDIKGLHKVVVHNYFGIDWAKGGAGPRN